MLSCLILLLFKFFKSDFNDESARNVVHSDKKNNVHQQQALGKPRMHHADYSIG